MQRCISTSFLLEEGLYAYPAAMGAEKRAASVRSHGWKRAASVGLAWGRVRPLLQFPDKR